MGADGSSDRPSGDTTLARRRYLALTGLATLSAVAGCAGGSGDNGGDSDPSDADGSGGSDPFSSIDKSPQTVTATLKQDTDADAVQVLDADGERLLEVDVTRGTAEIPVASVGDCGSCEEFQVHIPGGTYELAAIQIPEDDAERPTEVGRRSLSIDRSAQISGVELRDEVIAITLENTGEFLMRAQRLRFEPTDPTSDAEAQFYTRELKQTRIGFDRLDSPNHELRKTEGRPLLDHIVTPGSSGTFAIDAPRLYRSEGMTEGSACTGQSIDLQFEIACQGGSLSAAATGTMTYTGDVEETGDDSFVCGQPQITDVSPVDTGESSNGS